MSEEEIKKEIESIGYKEFYRYYIEKFKLAKQLSKQLQQKENIIKEAREYIEDLAEDSGDYIGAIDRRRKVELLEMLEKI